MDAMFGVLLIVFASSASLILPSAIDEASFNVMDYGAKCDGLTDDSHAFLEAWDAACSASTKAATVYVPSEATSLLNPIVFHGPCNPSLINFLILGRIVAPASLSVWNGRDPSRWLAFVDVHGLHVDGYGVVDGRGKAWWDNSCKYHRHLEHCTTVAPTAWKFMGCNESSVRNMKMINSGQTHILVERCNNFMIENVMIESPGNSPNTDGIHIHASHHLIVTNTTIACGDDCISIGDYISDVEISNIQCGPGHGISIGSLGKSGNHVQVENIHVSNASFNGTSNGARIKTWQVGRGYLRRVTFENLVFSNVKNPIIIDQNYCNIKDACKEMESGVEISNVVYREVAGTSASKIAINLNCSKSVPCRGIWMEWMQLTSAVDGRKVTANCRNAYGREEDTEPGPCLVQK